MTIEEKLRLLREGSFSLLTEAPKDNPDDDKDSDDDTKPKSNAENEDPADDEPIDTDEDENLHTDPEPPGGNDDDSTEDDSSTDDDSTEDDSSEDDSSSDSSDDEPSEGETPTDEPASNPNEFIQLDDNSRKLLGYKNFQKYRDLRDDVEYLITELTELTLVNDQARTSRNVVISKATDLMTKLNDYIVHKYKGNTYEINYRNFMDFVLEKRLVFQAKDEIIKLNSVK